MRFERPCCEAESVFDSTDSRCQLGRPVASPDRNLGEVIVGCCVKEMAHVPIHFVQLTRDHQRVWTLGRTREGAGQQPVGTDAQDPERTFVTGLHKIDVNISAGACPIKDESAGTAYGVDDVVGHYRQPVSGASALVRPRCPLSSETSSVSGGSHGHA